MTPLQMRCLSRTSLLCFSDTKRVDMFKNALVSVTDKTGLAEFLRPYVEKGLRVVSTGGTAKYLQDHKIPVVHVQEQTGFPEVMDGRVRTLHPLIHMALLARKENAEDMKLLKEFKIESFDLVIGNLYPFEENAREISDERELSEYIDIGGPALLRAAAKNYHQMTVISDPADYAWISEKSQMSTADNKKLAAKVFGHISSYDSLIARTLQSDIFDFKKVSFSSEVISELRYGENPQQKAIWTKDPAQKIGLQDAKILQGKALSYNNILDLDAAIDAAKLFDEVCCVAVKHNNPCGVAIGTDVLSVIEKALLADPKSVFGGVIALNRPLDKVSAQRLSQVFLECIIAPSVEPQALEVLAEKKNLRVLEWDFSKSTKNSQIRSISGGYLVQTPDTVKNWDPSWTVIGENPSQQIQKDLSFSWRVCSSLKSNAIAIVSSGVTIGLGMGQVSRVDSVLHALERMKNYHSESQNAVLASDAFFPFEDSIEIIAKAGIRWIIQPGGSIRDEQVLQTAKKLGVNMILTSTRHFKH